jgi:hypothetical protein
VSHLAKLIGVNSTELDRLLAALEASSGHQAVDAKLMGGLHEKTARIIKQLGLDPADTTSKELNRALANTPKLRSEWESCTSAKQLSQKLVQRYAALLGENHPLITKLKRVTMITKNNSTKLKGNK